MLPPWARHAPFTLPQVDVIPAHGTMEAPCSGAFVKQSYVKQSGLVRVYDRKIVTNRPAPYAEPEIFLNEHFLFGGYLFPHYGHFLLESLSRLASIQDTTETPLLFFARNTYFARWQHDILALLGCKAPLYVPERPVRVAKLTFFEPECVVDHSISDRQLARLGVVDPLPDNLRRTIWVSRANCSGGGLVNEQEIEQQLAKGGWEIYHPEAHSIAHQIQTLANASFVAGLDGSAFYTMLLARRVRARFAIVSRRGFFPVLLQNIFAKKAIPAEWILPKLSYVTGKGAEAVFRAHDADEIVRRLQRLAT